MNSAVPATERDFSLVMNREVQLRRQSMWKGMSCRLLPEAGDEPGAKVVASGLGWKTLDGPMLYDEPSADPSAVDMAIARMTEVLRVKAKYYSHDGDVTIYK